MTQYVLGGGCFWCLDALYRRMRGVSHVESGYGGGSTSDPTYYQVSSGRTGHAEVVRVTFDETIIPADVILELFFGSHDPTTLNRQGADIGSQYRSILLYDNPEQKERFVSARDKAKQYWDKPIVTEISPLEIFYPAEAEHQDYYAKQPAQGYCQVVITPKLVKARAAFGRWLKEDEPNEINEI